MSRILNAPTAAGGGTAEEGIPGQRDTERAGMALDRAAVVALVDRYVEAVDGRDMRAWADLFAQEASYVVVSRENVERGLPLALVMDHSRDRIEDRVTSVTKVWAGHINDYWPRHMISNLDVNIDTPSSGGVRANFALFVTEPDEIGSRLLAVGRYEDQVTLEGGVARFSSKKVVLDTTVLPRYFVYPI
ncbi:MAG: nuclear transport factor 2 family protein [Actinomycetota bacterium]|nr:nuclear transport factor 2 family protein [Actinomycetota bacterium]MDA8077284.1 nuclear transport factor 2 family protein [Actinomycetota bacterium]